MAGASILFGIEKAMEGFLRTICDDYSLPYDELYSKYFLPCGPEFDEATSSELPDASQSNIGSKATGKKKATPAVSTSDKKMCSALTTKKTPCKKFALDGSDFCSCHAKSAAAAPVVDDEGETSSKPKPKPKSKAKPKPKPPPPAPVVTEHEETESEGEGDDAPSAPMKKSKGKAKGKAKFPIHNHSPDSDGENGDHSDCEVCSESGNSTAKKQLEYDLDTDVKTRLSAILSQIDDDEGSGSETE
jgi:hypothetical protein